MALWTWIGIFSRFGETAGRISKTSEERIAPLDNPRTLGSALASEQAGKRRWQIGD